MSPAESISLGSGLIPSALILPTISDTIGVEPLDNSELRKIAEDVLNAAKYSLLAVVANPDQVVRPGSLEQHFRGALQKMDQNKRQTFIGKAKSLSELPEPARVAMFGRYGMLDTLSFLNTGFDRVHEIAALPKLEIDTKLLGVRPPEITVPVSLITRKPEGLLISSDVLPSGFEEFEETTSTAISLALKDKVMNERLADIWGPVYERDPFAASGGLKEFEEQAVTDKLAFHITRIKCVDETNPEWWGSDEIAIGGVSVDETGDTKKIGEQYVGGGFDDGDAKNYSPAWRYHWFGLNEGTKWPKHYEVVVTLAEKDWGGFANFLNDIWTAIKDRVKKAIEAAITGVLAEYLGPAIAAAIGKVVAWIIDKLVGWLISLWNDDIFPAVRLAVNIPSLGARWYYPNGTWGSPVSPTRTAHFYGYGGHYSVDYYWQLYA